MLFRTKNINSRSGFVLLELLLALFVLQVGMLGIAELFLGGVRASVNLERSLQALELLRGEMESLEKCKFTAINSLSKKSLAPGITYNLNVTNVDEDRNGRTDYKVMEGQVFWQDAAGKVRCYQIVTYRLYSFEFGME